jgi:hypothetical protein
VEHNIASERSWSECIAIKLMWRLVMMDLFALRWAHTSLIIAHSSSLAHGVEASVEALRASRINSRTQWAPLCDLFERFHFQHFPHEIFHGFKMLEHCRKCHLVIFYSRLARNNPLTPSHIHHSWSVELSWQRCKPELLAINLRARTLRREMEKVLINENS